mgnify:FL=1
MAQDRGALLRGAEVAGGDVEHVLPSPLPVQPAHDAHHACGHVDEEGGVPVPARDDVDKISIVAQVLVLSVNLKLNTSIR